LVFLFLLPLAAGCGEASSVDEVAAISFDPCQPLVLGLGPDATADQRAGAQTAVDWWNAAAGGQVSLLVGASDLAAGASGEPSLSPGEPSLSPRVVPLHFQAAAAPSHGFFDPARGQILVNDDLAARPLAVTVAHELGHAFGLAHVAGRASVMTAGNLDVQPNAGDVAALAKRWGACGPSASPP